MRRFTLLTLFSIAVFGHSPLYAQDSLEVIDRIIALPSKFLSGVNKRVTHLESKVHATSEKALAKLESKEARLKRKLLKKDSLRAEELFGNVSERFSKLRQSVRQKQDQAHRSTAYLPYFDTIKTSL